MTPEHELQGARPARRLLQDLAFQAAARAASRGWPVFPLRPYTKRPAIRAWQRQATTDVEQICAWWAIATYNIGIACGPAGLLVVDLDVGSEPSTRTGAEVLAELANAAGQPLPLTYTVTTPSGGQHLYYAAPDGVRLRNTAGLLGPNVDTRGAGGYVVGAGSARRMAGRRVPYVTLNEHEVAPLPSWLRAPLARQASPRHVTASVGRVGSYAAAALAGESRAVEQALPGTRNSTLFRAALNLGQLCGAGVLDPAVVEDALLAAARIHIGAAGFTRAEARRAIGNGIARGIRSPRHIAEAVD